MSQDERPTFDGTAGSVTVWIGALRGGESEEAARRLWDRYFQRLVSLARGRLRAKLPTGALVGIRVPGSWRELGEVRGELVSFVTPRDLEGTDRDG